MVGQDFYGLWLAQTFSVPNTNIFSVPNANVTVTAILIDHHRDERLAHEPNIFIWHFIDFPKYADCHNHQAGGPVT